jgi:hypothetical protein
MIDPQRRHFLKKSLCFIAALPLVSFFRENKNEKVNAGNKPFKKGMYYKRLAG